MRSTMFFVALALFMACASASSTEESSTHIPVSIASDESVLVLGSAGLIGQALVRALLAKGFSEKQVLSADVHRPEDAPPGHQNLDLRVPGALDVFNASKIRFVFFLACDVGGSKYIDAAQSAMQQRLIQNNIELFRAVLPWLEQREIPFVFTSSYLQGEPMAYGAVKRLGEMWVQQMRHGRTVRLWNVYGYQQAGLRAHVLNDWIPACQAQGGVIRPITDGKERRQFLHVNDTAAGLIAMLKHFPVLEEVTDMSTGDWINLRELATKVLATAAQLGLRCTIDWPSSAAKKRTMPEPDMTSPFHQLWQPVVDMDRGIRELFEQHSQPALGEYSGGGMCTVNQDCGPKEDL